MTRFSDEPQELFTHTYVSGRNSGKGFYVTMVALIIAVALITAGLCMYFASTAGAGDAASGSEFSIPESSSAVSEEPSSDALSSGNASSNESSLPTSSSSESDPSSVKPSSGTSSQPVSNKQAELAFEKNSVDAKHAAALNKAKSTDEMLAVYDTSLAAWKRQIAVLVTKLGAYTTANQKALQSAWEKQAAASIQQKENDLNDAGGTIQQLEVAGYTYTIYRQRALDLYIQLYRYNPHYTF